MNNLTQTQIDAKQTSLNRQAEQMFGIYQSAENNERSAIIKQIDSFLEIAPKDAKIFWLKFRRELEKLGEQSVF